MSEGVDAAIVACLADLVATSDDLTAHQLRPYELADDWDLPRDTVLEACLIATRLGLLEFEWHLLCPLCCGARARTPTLGGLEPVVHCDTCNIDFEVNFERSVELTFHPNPSIRHVVRGEYCIAGPRVTPHVVAQQLLAPGESRFVQLRLEPGHYRLRTLNQRGADAAGHRRRTAGGGRANPRHRLALRRVAGGARDEAAPAQQTRRSSCSSSNPRPSATRPSPPPKSSP